MVGTGITIDAEGTEEVGRALRRLFQVFEEPGPILDIIGQSLVTSTIDRFERERSPEGAPWKKSARARREGGQTLTDTARLRGSITHRVGPDFVEVGTNVVYAAIHQFGGQTPPRTIRPKRAKALKFSIGGRTVFAKSVRHPGSRIPARPFLGLSSQDEGSIVRVIDRAIGRAVR